MADENTTNSSKSSSDSKTNKAADLKKENTEKESSDSSSGDEEVKQYIEYFVDKAAEKVTQATGGNSVVTTIISLLKNIFFGKGLGSLTGGIGNTNTDSIFPGVNIDNPFIKRNNNPSGWSTELGTPVPEYHNVYKRSYIEPTFKTVPETDEFKKDLYNQNTKVIQNIYKFPKESSRDNPTNDDKTKVYDYQIIVGDPDLELSKSLEDKLQEFRASVGIPVHGNSRIARSMKFYMYNRFKVPDTNLAHNKTFTHVFFTRPDLNLLEKNGTSVTANQQVKEHSDGSLYWYKYPDLFKLLTDASRCGDSSNFNLLLSNQVQSFETKDAELISEPAGKNWNEYSIMYGNAYTNKIGNEFTCEFMDTNNLEIMHLMKLWMMYIDNVSRGAWKPSYDLTTGKCGKVNDSFGGSYVYTRTLDYAASAYVIKTGPDGEDILYWSKYYGIFPLNDGSTVLSWSNNGDSINKSPILTIRFAYSFKRDMNPISITEFNGNSRVNDIPTEAEIEDKKMPAFNGKYDKDNPTHVGSNRPFVGVPYIIPIMGNPILRSDDVASGQETHLKLRYLPDNRSDSRSDEMLFRPTLSFSGSKDYKNTSSYLGNDPLSAIMNAVNTKTGGILF